MKIPFLEEVVDSGSCSLRHQPLALFTEINPVAEIAVLSGSSHEIAKPDEANHSFGFGFQENIEAHCSLIVKSSNLPFDSF